jgi:hypothetical protein
MCRALWWAGIWLMLALPARGQQMLWEQTYGQTNPLFSTTFISMVHEPGGGTTVSGVSSAGVGYPAVYAQYSLAGQRQNLALGRVMQSGEQDLVRFRNGFMVVNVLRVVNVSRLEYRLLLTRLNGRGDTLWSRRLPLTATNGYPIKLFADGRGFTVAGRTPNRPGQPPTPSTYFLVRTDTAGTVQWVHEYPNPPTSGDPEAYAASAARTPRGGYLISGHFQFLFPRYGPVHPYLLETDSLGQERRRGLLVLQDSNKMEFHNRFYNNIIALRDGSGYVFSGFIERTAGAEDFDGFVVKVDTALRQQWLYRYQSPRGVSILPGQVRELPDGTLTIISSDYRPLSPYLYLHTLTPQGQLLRRREVRTATNWVRPYDWHPLAGDSAALVCGTAGLPGNRQDAWVARIGPGRPLPVAAARALPALAVYPQPAVGAAATLALPAGHGPATLTLHDAVGRELRRWPVPPGGSRQLVPLSGLPPGLYQLQLHAPDGRRWTGKLLRQ